MWVRFTRVQPHSLAATEVDQSRRLKAEILAHSHPVAARFAPATAGFLLFCCNAVAQEMVPSDISEPNPAPLTPAQVQVLQSGSTPGTAPGSTSGRAVSETPRRFQYNFSASERNVYDDNINISSSNRRSDFYFAIEPAMAIGFGDSESVSSFSLIYRPSLFLYLDNSQDDTVQHVIRLQAAHTFGRLALSLTQDMQILNGADLNSISDPTGHNANTDVGGRTRHDIYMSALSGTYQLSGKLFLSSAGNLSIDDYPNGQIGSKSFSGNLFINYEYREKIVVGLGGTGGYSIADDSSPDQIYEQANVRVGYNATAKIRFNASTGVEFREFSNNSRGIYVSPVYALDAAYQAFDGTSITLGGSRHTANSASLAGQDYVSTDIHCAVSQRFMQRISLGIAAGYQNSEYISIINGIAATRSDNYYYVEPSVNVNITRFWTAGAYYLHRNNASSFNFFSFYDNQVGFRTTVTF